MKRLELMTFLMQADVKKVKRYLAEKGVHLSTEQILAIRRLMKGA